MAMHVEAEDLAMALRGAYLTMHRKADSFFVKHGVTADQYVLLHLLARQSGVTQQTLVARASSDPNTVRAMLLLLEGRGLVTRERHPVDGRARSVSITKKGLAIYQRLRRASELFLAHLVSDFRPEEVQTLQELLRRIPPALTAKAPRGAPG
jgi:DNA-binding MarR family transcriptional regulator